MMRPWVDLNLSFSSSQSAREDNREHGEGKGYLTGDAEENTILIEKNVGVG